MSWLYLNVVTPIKRTALRLYYWLELQHQLDEIDYRAFSNHGLICVNEAYVYLPDHRGTGIYPEHFTLLRRKQRAAYQRKLKTLYYRAVVSHPSFSEHTHD